VEAIHKILCAVDFSDYSFGALQNAIGLARKFGACLYVYHAIHSARDPIYGTTEFNRGADLAKKTKQLGDTITTIMKDCAVAWEPVLSVGDPVTNSADFCRTNNVDLVVAASHGITAFKRVFLGTVVERMVRSLGRPILVVRDLKRKSTGFDSQQPLKGFQRMIAACDFQPDSGPSTRFAARLAASFRSDLHLLHVMESPVHEEMVSLTEAPYGEVQQKLLEKMETRLAHIIPDGTRSHTRILTGLPGEEIVAYAERHHGELIVIGVRSHTKFDKVIIGSSTEFVLRKAPCSVLAVPVDNSESGNSIRGVHG
jgi:nucleotide-binding universal stress UspA family protein